MNSKPIFLSLIALLIVATSVVWAHEKVKLSGYVVDIMCAADHTKDEAEAATKFGSDHTKSCGLMEECVKSGYGVFADGKWYPFNPKGNELAKAMFEKTKKDKNIRVTVEGMKHDGQILVEKITEE